MARGLARLAEAASDVRRSVRRARARRQVRAPKGAEHASAAEVKRRLDETRARLRNEIPPKDE